MRSKFLVVACLLWVGFCSPAWGISLAINPSSTSITVGDMFDVAVEISGLDSENLAEFDLDILFDDTVLNFNSYMLGTELGDFSLFEADNLSLGNDTDGKVNLAALSFIWPDLTDPFYPLGFWVDQPSSFTLATIVFDGISAGTSAFSIDGGYILGDEEASPLFFDSIISASITVANGTTPIPEPGSIFLLGAGLIGVVGIIRKRGNRN